MVALELQRDFIAELRVMLGGMRFKTRGGEDTELHIYEQNLPMQAAKKANQEAVQDDAEMDEDEEDTRDDEMEDLFPYCVVKLDSGKSQDASSAHIVKMKLVVGIYDDTLDASGYKQILNIFEDVRKRFRTNPILAKRYIVKDEMSWALPDEDEDTFPFFFGAMYLYWQTPEYGREDEYS